MRKFLAVVKHEYKKIVVKWTFLIGTLLFPVIGAGFAVVPTIIFSLKSEPIRLVIVDPTGAISPSVEENLSVEKIEAKTREATKSSVTDISASQEERLKHGPEQLASGFI